ncbi:hypothetical protein [Microbacterium aurum]
MSPEQARDTLITLIKDTSSRLDVDGWSAIGEATATACSGGLKWGYVYAAPIPDADHLAAAQTVSDYWASLGITVRTDTSHDPVVFGEGGPVQSISFETGPGSYGISATSVCVPGDPDDYP